MHLKTLQKVLQFVLSIRKLLKNVARRNGMSKKVERKISYPGKSQAHRHGKTMCLVGLEYELSGLERGRAELERLTQPLWACYP